MIFVLFGSPAFVSMALVTRALFVLENFEYFDWLAFRESQIVAYAVLVNYMFI